MQERGASTSLLAKLWLLGRGHLLCSYPSRSQCQGTCWPRWWHGQAVGQPWLGAPGGLCFHPWAAAVGRGSAPARKQDFALRCTEGVAVRHSPVLQGTKMLAPVGTAVACQCLCKLLLAPSEGLHQCGWQNRLSQAWRGFQSKSIPPPGTGIAQPLCCCQGVNRHFAISTLCPKHGSKS